MTNQSAEALYEQGMAHYQRRQWQAALDQFKLLKASQPNWPGLDALIDEVSWFLRLAEDAQPERGAAPADIAAEETPARSGRRSLSWLAAALLTAAALALVALWQGWIPGLSLGRNLEHEALYNRGQSSLAVGDYQGARAAFSELARLAPGRFAAAAQEGLERAARLEKLTLAYQAGATAIAAQDWETAEAQLQEALAIDPTYADASELLANARQQRQVSQLFTAGVAAYDLGQAAEAILQLERLADLDPAYQRDVVQGLLFVLYMNDGQALLTSAAPGPSADVIRQAIGRFGKALALRPRNVQAAEESQLASQFLAAREALDRADLRQAERLLRALVQARPDYAGGQAVNLLYELLVRQAEEERAAGNLEAARTAYEQALALPLGAGASTRPDRSAAQAGLQALQALATPTPTQPAAYVIVAAPILNVRLGPGADYPLLGQVAAGERLELVGRNETSDWLVVCCLEDKPGWVAARLVSVTSGVDLERLPVGLAPARPPQPTATPIVQPSAAPTAAASSTAATPTAGPATPPESPPATPEPPTPEPATPTPTAPPR